VLGVVVLPPLSATPDEDDDESAPAGGNVEDAAVRATDTWINPATMNAPTAIHPVVPVKDATDEPSDTSRGAAKA
jgi:hypothetical protein